jgi:uncharacterized protein (TIGR00255 family)
MIRSMTGFGRGQWRDGDWDVACELRSVNQRGLKLSWRLPDALRRHELELEGLLKKRIVRGHVFCTLKCEPSEAAADLIIDQARLRMYREVLDGLGGKGTGDPVGLLGLPNVIKREPLDEGAVGQVMPHVRETMNAALDELVAFREREGQDLAGELRAICAEIGRKVDVVESRAPVVVKEYGEKLLARAQRLLDGTDISVASEDLAREVAFFADRSDIAEELARLRSHVKEFVSALDATDPVGRKLEFMSQEMLREANTMCSKANDTEIIHTAVEIKTDIDRLREQTLNVE